MEQLKFNPSNPEYKKVADLPKENRKEFIDVENGFVRKEAFGKSKEAMRKTRRSFSQWIARKEKTSYLDMLREEAEISDPKVTKFIIEREDTIVNNTDNQASANAKDVALARSHTEMPYSYYRLSNLSKTNSVQILMRTDQGLKNINLPENMLDNIAKIIREDSFPRKEIFNCHSFVCAVNDMPHESNYLNNEYWDTSLLENEDNLKVGDTIFIADLNENLNEFSSDQVTHFAIYLNDGLFLSKGGDKNPLIVTTLKEMKRLYKSNHSYLIKPKKEQIETPRKRLLLLEHSGKYVFHGSSDIIDILEPRQAGGHNEKTGKWENDGSPAVFATPYADLAIFRSLLYDKDLENEFGINGDQLHMRADKKLIERAKNRTGMVYVLDKSKFNPASFRGIDCRSEEKIIPLEIIKVTIEDLPKNIEMVE